MTFGAEFLRLPDLFPVRLSGESWGEHEIEVDFEGGPYRFSGLGRPQRDAIEERFGPLVRTPSSRPPSLEARIFRAASDDFREIDTRGWSYSLDLAHEREAVRFAGLRLMARLLLGRTLRAGLWTPIDRSPHFEGVFENFFRVAVAYQLSRTGGALVHSAAVVCNGVAYLFPGRSGDGKSTLSRLALDRGAEVLSDDCNAVVARDGKLFVERLPFAGDLGQTADLTGPYPLAALVRLRKGGRNELTPLSAAAALAHLASCCPYLNVDPYRRDPWLAILESFVRQVPAHELSFDLSGDFLGLLDRREAAS